MIHNDDVSGNAKVASLTVREVECLDLLAAGQNFECISKRLKISNSTVAMHVTNARRKLKAVTREQAVAIALRMGLIK